MRPGEGHHRIVVTVGDGPPDARPQPGAEPAVRAVGRRGRGERLLGLGDGGGLLGLVRRRLDRAVREAQDGGGPGRAWTGLDGVDVHAVERRLQHEHEDQQGDQEQAKRRHVARAAAVQLVTRQLARLEQQERQGPGQPPVEVDKPFQPLPDQVAEASVVIVGVLAADVAIGPGQRGLAVGARGAGFGPVLRLAMQQGADRPQADDLELPRHAPSRPSRRRRAPANRALCAAAIKPRRGPSSSCRLTAPPLAWD